MNRIGGEGCKAIRIFFGRRGGFLRGFFSEGETNFFGQNFPRESSRVKSYRRKLSLRLREKLGP